MSFLFHSPYFVGSSVLYRCLWHLVLRCQTFDKWHKVWSRLLLVLAKNCPLSLEDMTDRQISETNKYGLCWDRFFVFS